MSDPRLRWDALADDLAFNQLPSTRKQAETWRTGLAGLTSLLGAVLIVKGRDTIADLAQERKVLVIVLLASAFAVLVTATLSALRAASGNPGDDTLLTGEDLRDWTEREVGKARRAIRLARALTLGGIVLVALAVGVAWLSPTAKPGQALVLIQSASGTVCGALDSSLTVGHLSVVVSEKPRLTTTVALTATTRVTPVEACP
ncbi:MULTISPECIES: hypothetical protein [Catenuloplanes]|uniref:Uncharacterized protein n=1 Tax=Catenuloplanes niger TaxID=587534 RepID=A0AAE4CX46_9ACTN|nr:hypothetical protein [Catenuloplanes niger]MDR7327865.1 hypothetical protein [Catenuloplanes niger]